MVDFRKQADGTAHALLVCHHLLRLARRCGRFHLVGDIWEAEVAVNGREFDVGLIMVRAGCILPF